MDKWRCNETDSQLAGKVTDDTMCYSFPHENDEDACIVSCVASAGPRLQEKTTPTFRVLLAEKCRIADIML